MYEKPKLLVIHTQSGYIQRWVGREAKELSKCDDMSLLGLLKEELEYFRLWGNGSPPKGPGSPPSGTPVASRAVG